MKNPFTPDSFPIPKMKRNSFDLGRRSVFTTDFFKIYPYFVQEVLPGDSYEIDARVGLRGMPTCFPVQTRIRISTEFFLVRNRTLDSGWEDRIFMNKKTEMPWLKLNNERAKKMISTGSLGDALGVPSTIGSSSSVVDNNFVLINQFYYLNLYRDSSSNMSYFLNNYFKVGYRFDDFFKTEVQPTTTYENSKCSVAVFRDVRFHTDVPVVGTKITFSILGTFEHSFPSSQDFSIVICDKDDRVVFKSLTALTISEDFKSLSTSFSFTSSLVDKLFELSSNGGYTISLLYSCFYTSDDSTVFIPYVSVGDDYLYFLNLEISRRCSFVNYIGSLTKFSDSVVDATDDSVISSNPFIGENPSIRLNALSFRAYEMITNYYFRSDRNNPYVLNGEPQYNEFIPTHDPGPDENIYDFHYRNWEMDRFTSSLQTPQMGEAPLVGVIFTGDRQADLVFSGSLDGGEEQNIKVTVGLDEDDNVESILNFSDELPSADLQRLMQRIQAGFSINQFRVTNSFQRFLENSLFRGRRYRNQMKSHHNVSVDYPDIDVPQYIGGASSIMDVGQVTNTADSPNAGLGDYIGTLQGGVATSHKIRCYCPEHGFIIGVVSFSPIPSYAQSISKHLIKRDALDYFSPEFGKIGFVPVRFSELSPLQTAYGQDVNDVFGYQKAWYDYMSALDEVHGDFRTTLQQFVCTRTFAERPVLSESFIVGSPEQLNNIFVTQNIVDDYGSSAKFLASSDVSCKVLRQIPIVGTPSLE